MALSTNAMRKETVERLLLDAGAIYKNLEFDETSGEFTGEVLGATSGGSEFVSELELRQPEIDGAKGRVKGMEFVDAHNANLVVNLKELTAENVRMGIGPADVDTSDENYDIVQPRYKIEMGDYTDNIAYVGRLSGSNKPVVIMLDNVLSAEGFTLTAEDNNEATIPITFYAHKTLEELDTDEAPYRIYWPKAEAV